MEGGHTLKYPIKFLSSHKIIYEEAIDIEWNTILGIVATIISINIGGITIALLWAIPLGIMIGALAPSILMVIFAMAQD
jgi:hypothetical protein